MYHIYEFVKCKRLVYNWLQGQVFWGDKKKLEKR
jgi:hypothetical protein